MMKPLTTLEMIQFILAPVVMITACALLLNSLGSRYTTVMNRLRSLSHERFDLLQKTDPPETRFSFIQERIQQIESQLPELLNHHKALHHAILRIYGAIALFLASMFMLSGAAMTEWRFLEIVALIVFLSGVGFLFLSILFIAVDFRQSHQVTENEVKRSCGLPLRSRDV
jgi:type IV secretory pathway VirB6-like protein